ncbi:hypothetical protein CALVIDRAFT_271996 [Calocera viscosa TUFC12733]|uniref:Uncharacterized protein n=1 Tax=Calocera viscosa (strain TUFC12733) TaxID=1330018 RepID=A0A167QXS7_CALVF|nr:hypothetical protein CALVIDRAFT_271996 [Calocera viscosa TUFC12733]
MIIRVVRRCIVVRNLSCSAHQTWVVCNVEGFCRPTFRCETTSSSTGARLLPISGKYHVLSTYAATTPTGNAACPPCPSLCHPEIADLLVRVPATHARSSAPLPYAAAETKRPARAFLGPELDGLGGSFLTAVPRLLVRESGRLGALLPTTATHNRYLPRPGW